MPMTGALTAQRASRRLLAGCLAAALLVQTSACTSIRFDKRSVYQYKDPFAVEDEAFLRSLSAFGFAMVDGNRAEILNNGDAIFPAMTAAIREAKRTVNLESYIFKDDRAGKIIAQALIDAARRGVEVRVLVDGTGSKFAGPLLARMRQAGVKATKYHPIRLWSIYKLPRRTHRKILVVDGTVSFTGGFCIADQWLGDARNPKEWRDMMVRATGPVSAQMQSVFSEHWTYTTGEILAGEKFYPRIEPAGTVKAQAIKISRGDSSSLVAMLYYVAIQSARKSIHIQNAYFVPTRQIRQALIQAARRGVDVQIMVPGRHIDWPLVRMASRRHYGELLTAGVRILEYNRTMMHNKDAVFDGTFSIVGSINFDARSLWENAEESLAFYDRDFGARMEATFADDEQQCREITYQRWKRRGVEQRLAELVSNLFRPLY
ncbi:MAG TPA: phospholipase D-like domain-containing protein [Thermoanaerobaculia bacterium]|jgi:cardiolipin synthase|nr:phospholipase D-like domain-containing protein [Thermoanaerobaculia bacterium]